jgi:Gas vesicle protein G
VIVLDKMLVGGVKFVLGKLAQAAEAELNDDSHLREELLAAQMRLEVGEIDEEEFASIEAALLARLREIRQRQMADAGGAGFAGDGGRPQAGAYGGADVRSGDYRVTGIEATIHGEEVRRR